MPYPHGVGTVMDTIHFPERQYSSQWAQVQMVYSTALEKT